MRKKRAVWNTFSNLLLQVIVAITGLLVPKFILSIYGSTINGMINSISQFLTYAALVEMGVGNAAIVALYRPLAENDWDSTNAVLSSTKRRYLFSGIVYVSIVIFLGSIYPIIISENNLNYQFVFFMVIVIAGTNALDYFILGKYKVFLSANQMYYILNIAKGISTLFTTVFSCILLLNAFPIIAVKLVAVGVHLGEILVIRRYVHRLYPNISFSSKKKVHISQQANALIHQLCCTVIYNTDLIVLTIFLPKESLKEVSVYTVYLIVLGMMTNLVKTLTDGMNSTFGDIIIREKQEQLVNYYNLYEFIVTIVVYILYSCFIVLIIPFVACYTHGVTDVNYIRISLAVLFGLAGITAQIKDASGVLIAAAGHYKQTQKYVIFEAVTNIVISIILVRKYGIEGVLIGTIVSHVLADFGYIRYVNKNILHVSNEKILRRIVRNSLFMCVVVPIEFNFTRTIDNWIIWVIFAGIITAINGIAYIAFNMLVEKELYRQVKDEIKGKCKKILNRREEDKWS